MCVKIYVHIAAVRTRTMRSKIKLEITINRTPKTASPSGFPAASPKLWYLLVFQ